ncbi:hypothetical protein [Macrococcoides canis]|nr:hypothetical protein [Macrococcus canis]
MDLVITLAANIGEISSIKLQNVMKQKENNDELFPNGVKIDINDE